MTMAAQELAKTLDGRVFQFSLRVIFPFILVMYLKNLGQKSGHRLLLLGNPSSWRAGGEQEHLCLES